MIYLIIALIITSWITCYIEFKRDMDRLKRQEIILEFLKSLQEKTKEE